MKKLLSLIALLALGLSAPAQNVLLEAESFAQTGGWVVDPQFMDLMGSPYLLAHGLGEPVADAKTKIKFPQPGTYRVWVRTKDWVAQWQAPGAPGRFQVCLDGKPLPTTFGTEGAQWHWQDGGLARFDAAQAEVTLHDLTGFEGRCDAILFARDPQFTPPNQEPAMSAFRRACLGLPEQPEAAGEFDLVVAGGGIAGTCAAIAAARLGLQVALIQDRPVLGGNNSSEVRVWLQGARSKEPWPRIGDVVAELEQPKRAHYGPDNSAEIYDDAKKLAVAQAEPNLRLFLEHRANAVEKSGAQIRAIIAQEITTGRRMRIVGRWFADCTGDASVGALAGADYEMEPKGHMGPCNLWNVCECKDTNALNTTVAAAAAPVAFPRCPWALDLTERPFPGRSKTKPDPLKLGGWYWESGFDRDPISDMEYIRDWNFRAMYGAWDAMKNVDRVLPNHRLNWAAYILGKRESRRLLGDVILSFADFTNDVAYADGCAPTGWSNDLHLPDPRFEGGFEGDAFISKANFGEFPAHRERRPYWIPYRCLYSRNVPNLFMAGRDISVKHEALGAVRVMRTGGCMGEIVGMAASVCKKRSANPRDIYERYLPELQAAMRQGVGKTSGAETGYENGGEGRRLPAAKAAPKDPAWLAHAGPNLARNARLTVSGTQKGQEQTVAFLNDGTADTRDNKARWLSEPKVPHWIELTWENPVSIGAARLVSGYTAGGTITGPVTDFTWQYHDGTEWKDLAGAAAKNNETPFWSAAFKPVTTARLRVLVTKTRSDISRIWEVEVYGPAQ